MFPLLTVYMDQHVLPASPAHKRRQSYDDSVVAAVMTQLQQQVDLAIHVAVHFVFAHIQEAMEFSSFGAKVIIPKP